jgi:hypothetical protein
MHTQPQFFTSNTFHSAQCIQKRKGPFQTIRITAPLDFNRNTKAYATLIAYLGRLRTLIRAAPAFRDLLGDEGLPEQSFGAFKAREKGSHVTDATLPLIHLVPQAALETPGRVARFAERVKRGARCGVAAHFSRHLHLMHALFQMMHASEMHDIQRHWPNSFMKWSK